MWWWQSYSLLRPRLLPEPTHLPTLLCHTQAGGGDDASYWTSLLPEAVAGHEQAKVAAAHQSTMLAPRQRKQVDYKGQVRWHILAKIMRFAAWPIGITC